jgi:CRP-like cAMP-binding protein
MYIIQSGKVVVSQKKGEKEIRLAELGEGDFFGVLALFTRELRSATVRAQGDVVVLTVDKKTLLHRIQRDPTLAFRIIQNLSSNICELNAKHSRVIAADRRDWDTRPDRKDDKD